LGLSLHAFIYLALTGVASGLTCFVYEADRLVKVKYVCLKFLYNLSFKLKEVNKSRINIIIIIA